MNIMSKGAIKGSFAKGSEIKQAFGNMDSNMEKEMAEETIKTTVKDIGKDFLRGIFRKN